MFFLCHTRISTYLFLGMLWRLGLMHRRWSDYWHMLGVQYTLDIYLNSVDIYWFLATFKDLCWVLVSHWVDKPQVWCSTEYSQPLPSLLSSSLHLTEHVGVCWPQASSDESWVRSGQSIFFPPTCFCNRPSFQSEYLDTFYKVVSRKKKKKTNTCSFALGFSLKQMNPWCMKRLSGWLKEAECWDKAGRLLLHAPMWGLFSWVKQGLARQAVPL